MSAGADVTIPDKLFFRIGEVAELTEIPPYVLRYWESEFKLLRPRKNHAGQRVYRRADIELVLRIKRLLYEDRLTLEGAKKRLLQDARGRSQQLELPAPDAHTLEILRGGASVFAGRTRTSQIKRGLEELAAWLFRELRQPAGAFLFTGTGIVPGEDFSLRSGDVVRIDIDGLVLENPVE